MSSIRYSQLLVIGASIAFLLVLGMQVQWMSLSRKLVEDQFDAEVNRALRMAAEQINQEWELHGSLQFLNPLDDSQCGTSVLQSPLGKEKLRSILDETFQQFALPLTYAYQITQVSNDPLFFFGESPGQYACKVGGEEELLQIRFIGKKAYVRSRMRRMTVLTLISLGLSLFLFWLTIRQLIKQKKLNQWNIDFFNSMAHEFRTPLTNMKLALGLLRRKSTLPKTDPYLQILEEENQHLFDQVERVLDIEKFKKEQLSLHLKPLSLNQLCRQIVEKAKIQVESKEGRIDYIPSPEDYRMRGDALHIGNAIRNLIDNAVKYNERTPLVKMELGRQKDYACISIQDNGVGIPRKYQSVIFQRFFRFKAGNPAAVKGFGLGLAYAKNVVEQHAGHLRLFSQPGQGTTLQLFFPIDTTEKGLA